MRQRGTYRGMIAIVRFNWPFYLAGALIAVASLSGIFASSRPVLKAGCAVAFLLALYFVGTSLGVSHLVYDRSDLYRWGWLDRALRDLKTDHAVFCHTGLDEASVSLRAKYPDVRWQVLDHFDEQQMTEMSIHRARALFPPPAGTLPARHNAWPLAGGSTDVVFGLLAIHELRTEAERRAWFTECSRCLRDGGRVILVEHLRDLANFVAFGPAFLHFHSKRSWRKSWDGIGLRCIDEFRITPFLRVFVLAPP